MLLGQQVVVKKRLARKYRHPTLDKKIREKCLLQESRNMLKVRKAGVPVPALYYVDNVSCSIYMEQVFPGFTVKEFLLSYPEPPESLRKDLADKIGRNIALIHNCGCVHGDLTTSNMVMKPFQKLELDFTVEEVKSNVFLEQADAGVVYMIDFGLSFVTNLPEDFAVDLYVLERAIISLHPQCEELVSFK